MQYRKLFFYVIFVFMFTALWANGASERSPEATLTLDDIRLYVDTQNSLVRMQRQENCDWDQVRALFKKVEPFVAIIDEYGGSKYLEEIPEAIEKCAAGENMVVNSQITGKGFNHITFLAIERELDRMYRSENMAENAKGIAALAEGIRAPFQRRDRNFFPETKEMEKGFDECLKSLADSNKSNFPVIRRKFEDHMFRNFALCVYYEIHETQVNRDENQELAERHLMEGVVYYRIIADRVKKNNHKSHVFLSNMLNSTIYKADETSFMDYLKQGMGDIPLI
ncbi:MAG: hypothetical protein JXR70_17720 [Spirochaetales bacterium]|nr:hypothetical protein [Spirochaetales bacterium]